MKRKLWIVIAAAALLAVFWCGAALADQSGTCGDNLTWTLTDSGALTISGYGEMTNYSTISGTPWYSSRSSVKSITIEDGVKSIGRRAFYGCTGVTGVKIPASVMKIGYLAFNGCSSLSNVIILNDEAEIGDSDHDVFDECASNITLNGWSGSTTETYASAAGHAFVTLDSGSCGANLFYTYNRENKKLTISGTGKMTNYSTSYSTPWYFYRSSISYITIADGVTSISRFAFADCTSLDHIAIPFSVTNIGFQAFRDCRFLITVTIPNPECVIGDSNYDVFSGCDLKIVGWPGSTAETYAAAAGHTFKSLDNISGQLGDNVYYNINPQTGAVSITGTGPMWDYNSSLHSPLQYNEALSSVTIGSDVTSIDDYVFDGCTGLKEITVAAGNSKYCSENGILFDKNQKSIICYPAGKEGSSYIIPPSVTSVGDNAFSYCTDLTSVTISNGVKCISKSAFYACSVLTNVMIPNSVTSIGNNAFSNCTSLTSVTIPNSVTSIGDSTFYNCTGLTSVTIPTGVTSIGNYTFYNCTGLISVTIPTSVTSIGDSTFYNCTSLTSVTIPNSVTSIGEYAFAYCGGLTSVTIPSSVTVIGHDAFSKCKNLANVTIHNRETELGFLAFGKCASPFYLHGHTGSTAETYAEDYSGITFVALIAEMGTPDFTLPANLTTIEAEAFWGNKASIVYIPDTVTSIGSKAFANNTNLTQIRIPASVTVIPPDLFFGLSPLQLSYIIIFSTPGSAAETYAKENYMRFEVE